MKKLVISLLLSFLCSPAVGQSIADPTQLGCLTGVAGCVGSAPSGFNPYSSTNPMPVSGGAATSISIGTTTVTGGTNTDVLYDNGGVVGNTNFITVGSQQVTLGSNTQNSSPIIAPLSVATTAGQASGLWGTFLTTGTVYNAFGDSITSGTGASPVSDAYANLIAADSNAVIYNPAISGEMACDMGQNEVFNLAPLSLTSNSFNTMMIGTNEAAQKGVGTYEAVYKNCHQSAMAWLAVPSSYKVYAQNAACVQTGTWAVDSSIITGVAEKSTTNGSTLTCSVPTYGGAVYIWYQQKDSNGGVFTYNVDGAGAVSVNAFTSPAIATGNGGTLGIGYVRLTGIASGTHSIVFNVTSATSASNIVSIYGVGTAPQLYYANQNTVFASGLIPEQNLANNAATLAYDADAQADAQLLASDGLPIRYAPIQPYFTAMCPGATSACMFNSLHPNNAGHELIHEAFAAIMQYPKSALPVVAIGGVNYLTTNSANLASTTALNPGIVFYSASGNPFGIDLGNSGSYYDTRIFTAASGGIAFGIQATNPTGQSSFTQWAAFKGGFLGIGVTTPPSPLSVNGGAQIGSGYSAIAAPTDGLIVAGNTGIGTANPATPLEVYSSQIIPAEFIGVGTTGAQIAISAPTATNAGVDIYNGTTELYQILGSSTGGYGAFDNTNSVNFETVATSGTMNIGEGMSSTTSGGIRISNSGKTVALYTGNEVQTLTATASQTVGIGTATTNTGSVLTLAGHPGYYQAAVPVVSSCGSGTAATGSTDNKGQITSISAATACTITFGSAMPTAPACSFSDSAGTAVGVSAISTSAVTASMTALTGTLYYICQ